MKPKFFRDRNSLGLALAAMLLAATGSHAQDTWDGSTDGNWGTGANWVDGSAPASSATTDIAFYASGAANLTTSINVGSSGRTIRSLTFNDDADNNVSIVLNASIGSTTGRTLTLGNSTNAPGITVTSGSTGSHTIGSLTYGGITIANNLTVTHDGSGVLTIAKAVADGTSDFSLTKAGSGTLILSAANTYSGGTNVNGGILVLASTSARPTTGTVAVGASGIIGLGVGGSGYYSAANVDSLFDSTLTSFSLDAASGVAIDTTAGDFTQNTDLATATRSLTKLGDNTLTLSGTNSYGGGTSISKGTVRFTSPAAMPASGAVSVLDGTTLAVRAGAASGEFTNGTSGNGTIGGLLAGLGGQSGGTVSYSGNVNLGIDTTTADGGSLTYSGDIGDVGTTLGITKLGIGTLILDGTNNTFTGSIKVDDGTLLLDSAVSPSAGLDIPGGSTAGATLDLNGTDQTLSRFVFNGANIAGNLTITGGTSSTLTINTTTDTQLGAGGAITATRNVTTDMSGLGGFVWNGSANTFRVAARTGATNTSGIAVGTFTTTLAGSNTITAIRLGVGDSAVSSHGGTSILRLGQTNTINADTINIGAGGRNNATLEYRTGLTGTPTTVIRGTLGGTTRVPSWQVGRVAQIDNSSEQNWTSTVDFSAGSLDARVTELSIGMADATTANTRTGVLNSTFTMGMGTLDVTTLNIGMLRGTTGTTGDQDYIGNGTFTLNDATGIVTAENVYLGVINNNFTDNTGAESTSGTFNLSAGTLEAMSIDWGASAPIGIGTATRAFNFSGGTLRNYAGSDLTISNVPINLTGSGTRVFEATSGQSVTVSSAIGDGGSGLGFTKSGAGTLTLSGTNTYSGNTTVSAGTLSLGTVNASNESSTVTIAATGATLNLTFGGTDTVDKLFIGTTQMPAGVYGPSATSIAQITGSGTLTVTSGPSSGTTFSSWIAGTFANGQIPEGQRGPNQDYDNDGVSNLVEFAIEGEDPTVPKATVGSFNGTTLSFTKRAGTSGLSYAILESTDLGILDGWTEVSGATYTNDGTTISYDFPGGGPARNFLRLTVMQTP